MIGDFGRGFGYALDGLRSLGQPGLRRYVAMPLLVNLAMFAVGGWWIAVSLGDLVDWVQRYLPEWLDWLWPGSDLLCWPIWWARRSTACSRRRSPVRPAVLPDPGGPFGRRSSWLRWPRCASLHTSR